MSLGFCEQRREVGVLTQDGDGGEAVFVRGRLGDGYACLQSCRSEIAVAAFGDYEAKRDEVVGVGQREEVVPVSVVKACQGGEDEDALAILDGRGGGRDVVHVVVDDGWGRRGFAVVEFGGFLKGERGWGEGVAGGIFGLDGGVLGEGKGGERGGGAAEEEVQGGGEEDGGEDVGDGVGAAEGAGDGHGSVIVGGGGGRTVVVEACSGAGRWAIATWSALC